MKDLLNARRILEEGGYTCVICRGEECRTATARGVKPLVNWLDAGLDVPAAVPPTRWWARPPHSSTA